MKILRKHEGIDFSTQQKRLQLLLFPDLIECFLIYLWERDICFLNENKTKILLSYQSWFSESGDINLHFSFAIAIHNIWVFFEAEWKKRRLLDENGSGRKHCQKVLKELIVNVLHCYLVKLYSCKGYNMYYSTRGVIYLWCKASHIAEIFSIPSSFMWINIKRLRFWGQVQIHFCLFFSYPNRKTSWKDLFFQT